MNLLFVLLFFSLCKVSKSNATNPIDYTDFKIYERCSNWKKVTCIGLDVHDNVIDLDDGSHKDKCISKKNCKYLVQLERFKEIFSLLDPYRWLIYGLSDYKESKSLNQFKLFVLNRDGKEKPKGFISGDLSYILEQRVESKQEGGVISEYTVAQCKVEQYFPNRGKWITFKEDANSSRKHNKIDPNTGKVQVKVATNTYTWCVFDSFMTDFVKRLDEKDQSLFFYIKLESKSSPNADQTYAERFYVVDAFVDPNVFKDNSRIPPNLRTRSPASTSRAEKVIYSKISLFFLLAIAASQII